MSDATLLISISSDELGWLLCITNVCLYDIKTWLELSGITEIEENEIRDNDVSVETRIHVHYLFVKGHLSL